MKRKTPFRVAAILAVVVALFFVTTLQAKELNPAQQPKAPSTIETAKKSAVATPNPSNTFNVNIWQGLFNPFGDNPVGSILPILFKGWIVRFDGGDTGFGKLDKPHGDYLRNDIDPHALFKSSLLSP